MSVSLFAVHSGSIRLSVTKLSNGTFPGLEEGRRRVGTTNRSGRGGWVTSHPGWKTAVIANAFGLCFS